MSLNLSSIFVCAMCIFFIYVDGTPVTNVFKQARSTDTETTPGDSEIEIKNIEEQLFKSMLTTLIDSKQVETSRSAVAKLYSCLKQNVAEHDFQFYLEELRSTIVRNEVIASETGISNEINSESVHEYIPRDLYDEPDEFTEIPVIKSTDTKRKMSNADRQVKLMSSVFKSEGYAKPKPKRSKRIGGVRNFSIDGKFDFSTSSNSIAEKNVGNKISSFSGKFDSGSLALFNVNDKEKEDTKTFASLGKHFSSTQPKF